MLVERHGVMKNNVQLTFKLVRIANLTESAKLYVLLYTVFSCVFANVC